MMAQGEITEVERKAFKTQFNMYDKNKDGHITSGELKDVLRKLGQNSTDEEIAEFIKACDVDKNGTIEFGEFSSYLSKQRRKVFKEIDTNGNGFVTPKELLIGFKKLGVADLTLDEAKDLVRVADSDGDGRVNYAEFVKTLQDRPLP